jgi:exosome complex exonuclease DIS3/RRP44
VKLEQVNRGIDLSLVRQAIESIQDHPELLDKLSVESVDQEETKFSYSEHLSPLKLSAGLKSGLFYQGSLSISHHNYLEVTKCAYSC